MNRSAGARQYAQRRRAGQIMHHGTESIAEYSTAGEINHARSAAVRTLKRWQRSLQDALGYCRSRAGVVRDEHSYDKDGTCVFCDQEKENQ